MIKIILNNDTAHVIEANEMNYSAVMGIDNYSQHSESIGLNVSLNSLSSAQPFENVRIESLKILNAQDEEMATLNFSEDLYITNLNSNIYNDSSSAYININKINKIVEPESEQPEE